jgi:hypothetical protein
MLFSQEYLQLPASVLGFTVARGLLVVESLVPENTYVDPGFNGAIYTTVTNLSGRVLKIPYGTAIARLFLYRLSENVEREYRTGPAMGIPQHLDSASGVAFPTAADARKGKAAALIQDLVNSERGGVRTAELLRRNASLTRVALFIAILWPPALAGALAWPALRAWAGPVASSVLSGIVTIVLTWAAEKTWRHISEAG